jgi:thiol-disulfide isomerase/thioredoxin
VRAKRGIGALFALMMLGLAACGTDTPSTDMGADASQGQETPAPTEPTPSGGATQKTTEPTEPTAVKELRFTAETVQGEAFDGTTLAGEDAVLWFWAPWCTECRREAPHVAKAQKDNPTVVFVGVAGLGDTNAMSAFIDDYQVGAFAHLADLDGSLWQRFGVVQQPAYAFVDDTGEIEVYRGELGEDGLTDRVGALSGN